MNVWFLGIVAIWRLCLLYYFMKHFTILSGGNIFTVTFMPICLIITVLTSLNLHKVVFEMMRVELKTLHPTRVLKCGLCF
jgi:hypothetical protein